MVARGARPSRRATGQHFLSRRTAAELVRFAAFGPDDLVVEIGAGTGALTRELASVVRRVVAIELDPRLASGLRNLFAEHDRVVVVEADVRSVPMPRRPFRAFGNLPFGITTAVLHRLLDDPRVPLVRADVIVQEEVAHKRTAVPPRSSLTLSWLPWWRFERGPSINSAMFSPRPSVDAAVLTIVPRDPALLPVAQRRAYVALVRRAFRRAGEPLPRALRDVVAPASARKRLKHLGVDARARPVDLDVGQWARLFVELADTSGPGFGRG